MKKFILLIVIVLSIGYSVAYANSIDQLENQGETESVAGITWDQINEMSQNSPNSLTPIQGLVLWMFAILAFLKLAQKMDSLLQSLGLNVTQTGGRAIGDLVMAGMALKHVGGAISRGMGAFGFSGNGGGSGGGSSGGNSGSGSGTSGGTSNAGGRGPVPIPGSPGGSSPGGGAAPSGGRPGSGTPGSSPSGSAHGSGAPSGASPTSATPGSASTSTSSATSTDSSAGNTGETSGNNNPVGNPNGEPKGDSFARGAVKAGAKGGLIGLGIYSAKAGYSKIREMSVARNGAEMINSTPDDNMALANNGNYDGVQQSNFRNNTGVPNNENPESYQDSKPLDGTEDSSSIPTNISSEEYQDADAAYDSGAIPSTVNNEDYYESDHADNANESGVIPTTISDSGTQDDYEKSLVNNSIDGTDNAGTWHESRSADGSTATAPIPSSANDENWNHSSPTENPVSETSSQNLPLTAQPAEIPIASSPQETKGATTVSPQQSTASGTSVSSSDSEATVSPMSVTQPAIVAEQPMNSNDVSNAEGAIHHNASEDSGTSSSSSAMLAESVSTNGITTDSSVSQASNSESKSSSGSYEAPAPLPQANQAISAEPPQNAPNPTALPDNSENYSEGMNTAASFQSPPISSDIGGTDANVSSSPHSVAQTAQTQSLSEPIRTESPQPAPLPPAPTTTTVASEIPQNTVTQPQTSQPVTHTVQPAAQAVHVEGQTHSPPSPATTTNAPPRPVAKPRRALDEAVNRGSKKSKK